MSAPQLPEGTDKTAPQSHNNQADEAGACTFNIARNSLIRHHLQKPYFKFLLPCLTPVQDLAVYDVSILTTPNFRDISPERQTGYLEARGRGEQIE